ncbi:MAG: hypothetical protein E7052_10730 [Lentisphaerae bacterium]|nr:hypothetical protein [Lentisphaerota bacterium]
MSKFVYKGEVLKSQGVYWEDVYVYSGGSVDNIAVFSGNMHIYQGGSAYVPGITHGAMDLNGKAVSACVYSSGYLHVSSGGIATDAIIVHGSSYAHVYDGGSMARTSTLMGTVIGSSGSMITDTYMLGGGVYVYSGSIIKNTLKISGSMAICGGSSINITQSAGITYVYSGGKAVSNFISNGNMNVYSNGTAEQNNIIGNGRLNVFSGGTATKTTLHNGINSLLKGGLYISSNGVASDTTVNSGGILCVDNGGVHRGYMQIADGAVVSASIYGVIDFTVSNRTAADGYLINNLSLIQGNASYTITVANDQAKGIYKLADNAAAFNSTVSIGNGSVNYGKLAVGQALDYNNLTYSLSNDSGKLHLVVSDYVPPVVVNKADLIIDTISTDISTAYTSQSVTVSFTIKNSGNAAAGATEAYIYDGNTLLGKVSVGALAVGGAFSGTFTIAAGKLSVGTHTLTVVADGGNVVAESNESNNSAAQSLNVTAPPAATHDIREYIPEGWESGLVIAHKKGNWESAEKMGTYEDTVITNEDDVFISFGVTDDTAASAHPTFQSALYIDGVYVTAWNSESSTKHNRFVVDYNYGKLSVGTHTIKMVHDSTNLVSEINENNNVVTKTIVVERAVHDIKPYAPDDWSNSIVINNNGSYKDSSVNTKDNVYVNVAFEDDSNAAYIHEFYTAVYLDGKYVDSYVCRSDKESDNWFHNNEPLNLGKLSIGEHTITLKTDYYNDVAESNESNNTITRKFVVAAPPVVYDDAVHFKNNSLSKTALTNSADGKTASGQLTGFIGKGDAEDYFHVVTNGPAQSTISLSGLTCKAKVTLYDANKKKIKTYSLKGNGTIYSGYLPGDYYVAVTSADKGKGKYNTNYSVNINAVYAPGDAAKNNSFNEAAASASKLATANTFSGWVGMGDIADYYKFTNVSGEKLSFTVTGVTAKLKLTVYDRNLKKVKSVSIKKDGTYLTNLLVNGDFFVAVESSDKGKKQHSNYNISVKADIFPVEAKFNNDRSHASNLAQSGNGVVNTWDGVDAQIDDWVGFGDKSDYFAFEMTKAEKIDFNLELDDDNLKVGKAVKVTLYNAAGKKVALDKLMTTKKDLAIGKYFVEVSTSNEKKYLSGYNLDITIC